MHKFTDGMRCTVNLGSGDLPIGQFDAQDVFPSGSGMSNERK